MGFSVRSLAVLALVLTPAIAAAQAPPPPPAATAPPPPPGGGSNAAPASKAAAGSGAAAGAVDAPPKPGGDGPAKSTSNLGGVSFNDKPIRRGPVQRAFRGVGGPLATFPGFEQLPDGGSRLFVQISQAVAVEERRANGSVTYVLKGAHLRVNNDANALVTVHFNTPVFRARLSPQGNDLLFILELRAAVSPTFRLSPNTDKTATLQIDFAKGDFITGDGSELLPSERRPEKRLGRVNRRDGRGARPESTPTDNGNNDTIDPNGPNP